jgi:hypothetical protein
MQTGVETDSLPTIQLPLQPLQMGLIHQMLVIEQLGRSLLTGLDRVAAIDKQGGAVSQ